MSKQRAKGTRFESAVVAIFAERFPFCERRALRGNQDGGDLAGLPVVVECKNTKAIDLAGGCTEAARAAVRVGTRGWIAVFKRTRHPDRAAYFVTSLEFGVELLAAWDLHGNTDAPLFDRAARHAVPVDGIVNFAVHNEGEAS